jgi:hypothetical protein
MTGTGAPAFLKASRVASEAFSQKIASSLITAGAKAVLAEVMSRLLCLGENIAIYIYVKELKGKIILPDQDGCGPM